MAHDDMIALREDLAGTHDLVKDEQMPVGLTMMEPLKELEPTD
jgi:hypothetical protein